MSRLTWVRNALCGFLFLLVPATALAAPGPRSLPRAVLEDKIRGGWAGQIIGVQYGAPTEFSHSGETIEGDLQPLTKWKPERVEETLKQDDLYVEMTFAEVMDRVGLDATTKQYGDAFRDSQYELWHANAAARRLLKAGMDAPASSDPKFNLHANDIDFQIEADFIGLMTPGLPAESNKFAERVGLVMNRGDGLYGGMFAAAMYAAAFFESDVRKVVESGLASIPAASGYAQVIRDVLALSKKNADWRVTWQAIEDKWNRQDVCPDGALTHFNIDARLNGAYVVLGLLYGNGDVDRTLEVSVRAGQDSDCNPASAMGVLGTIVGWKGIPDRWKSGFGTLVGKKFSYTNYSFEDIVTSTQKRALAVIERAGGKVEGDNVLIPVQKPTVPKLEQIDLGVPDRRLNATEADAFRFDRRWKTTDLKWHGKARDALAAGAVMTLAFVGDGIVINGYAGVDGGRADVTIDGKPAGQLEAYAPPGININDVFHAFGLGDKPHVLKLVVRDDAEAASKGKRVAIYNAKTFRKK